MKNNQSFPLKYTHGHQITILLLLVLVLHLIIETNNMTMTYEEIIEWGVEVPRPTHFVVHVVEPKPKINGIHRLLEHSRKVNRRRCRVCTGTLGENPECSFCEHKRDEMGWGV